MSVFRSFFLQKPTVLGAFLLLLLGLTSCEKVLDIKLKDTPSRIVIEANLNDQLDTQRVFISRSVGFNELNNFPMVSGAKITLTDNTGLSETYQEVKPGIYELPNFKGEPGKQYTLTVEVENQTFTAVSVMPQPVAIQNIKTEPFQFNPDRLVAVIEFQEPAATKNYYRGIYEVNDTVSTNLFFFSDEFNNGKFIDELFIDQDLELNTGDAVTIKLRSIDENNFKFLRDQDQLSNSQSSSPANPRSNLSNGALGYFSAHAETAASLVVP